MNGLVKTRHRINIACNAYYMDKDKAVRERGVTINCTTKEFFTDS